jgi:hypothetical protein
MKMIVGAMLGAALAGLAFPAQAAETKPPACAAISFRPLTGAPTDGEMDAGLYRSKFGRIEIKTIVRDGRPGDYFMLVNGKAPAPIKGEIPKSAYGCLESKHVKVPPRSQSPTCTGSRLRVVIDSSGKEKLLMLFGLHGDDWKLCQAATSA